MRPSAVTLVSIWLPPPNILWDNITQLEMVRVIPEALLGVLPYCDQLKKIWFSFKMNHTGRTFPVPTATIYLPHLTEAKFQDIDEQDPTTFFIHIKARALRVLKLARCFDGLEAQAFPLTSIRHLLMGAEESLVGLYFDGISFFGEDLMALLEPLSVLRSLSLKYEDDGVNAITDVLLARLSTTVERSTTANFLPSLVILTYTGPRTFTWDSVATFMDAHIGCKTYFEQQQSRVITNKRDFTVFTLKIVPERLPEDYIDEDVLMRFMRLPPSWVRLDVEGDLMEGSFKHHGLHQPKFVFAHPLAVEWGIS